MVDIQITENSRKILLFFTLTFTISWSIWFLAPLIYLGDVLLFNGIGVIGAFGPSISALIITSRTGIKSPGEDIPKKKKQITFIIILIVSILSALSMFLINQLISFFAFLVFFGASIIASIIFSGMFSSNPDITDLLQPIKGVKGKNIYLLIAFLLPLLANLGGFLIFIILGGILPTGFNLLTRLLYITCLFPYIFFFGGPLNEEIGWRGLATPRLQEKYSPLITGLIIGIIWSVWHAPLHFIGFYPGGVEGFLMRFTYNIPFGIIFTWYYNKSKGNLLGAIIFHASVNVYNSLFLGAAFYTMLLCILFVIFIMVQEKMWKKVPVVDD